MKKIFTKLAAWYRDWETRMNKRLSTWMPPRAAKRYAALEQDQKNGKV